VLNFGIGHTEQRVNRKAVAVCGVALNMSTCSAGSAYRDDVFEDEGDQPSEGIAHGIHDQTTPAASATAELLVAKEERPFSNPVAAPAPCTAENSPSDHRLIWPDGTAGSDGKVSVYETTRHVKERENALAQELVVFYATVNPGVDKSRDIPKIASDFCGKEDELNQLLHSKYGADLTTHGMHRMNSTHKVSNKAGRASASETSSRDTPLHVQEDEYLTREIRMSEYATIQVPQVSTARGLRQVSPERLPGFRPKTIRPSSALGHRNKELSQQRAPPRPRSAPLHGKEQTRSRVGPLNFSADSHDSLFTNFNDMSLEETAMGHNVNGIPAEQNLQFSPFELTQRAFEAMSAAHRMLAKSDKSPLDSMYDAHGAATIYSDIRLNNHAKNDFSHDGVRDPFYRRRTYVPRQASLRLDYRPQSAQPDTQSHSRTLSSRRSRPSSAVANPDKRVDRTYAIRGWHRDQDEEMIESPQDKTQTYQVSDGRRPWRRKNVHSEQILHELEALARLLHLPRKMPEQSLDWYAKVLRLAARNIRTDQIPPRDSTDRPSTQRKKQLRRLASAGSHSRRLEEGRSQAEILPFAGKRDPEDVLVGWAKQVYEIAEGSTGSLHNMHGAGTLANGKVEGGCVDDFGRIDVEHLTLMQALKKASTARHNAYKVLEKQHMGREGWDTVAQRSTGQIWYVPDGANSGLLPSWVPRGKLAHGRAMSKGQHGRVGENSRRRPHATHPFASTEIRFPEGRLLDETKFVHGMHRLDVAPKIPPSTFGKQVCSHMRSPPGMSFSRIPRPPPHFFSGLEHLRCAPEISSVPLLYEPSRDQLFEPEQLRKPKRRC
jgi:hypothetical protein